MSSAPASLVKVKTDEFHLVYRCLKGKGFPFKHSPHMIPLIVTCQRSFFAVFTNLSTIY